MSLYIETIFARLTKIPPNKLRGGSRILESGKEEHGFIPKIGGGDLNFNNSMTYYGHITNYEGIGSVSGELEFSVATS